MIKNFIKTAIRQLWKNKFYSLVNMSGLTIGLAVGMLILLWVQDEQSYDAFHHRANDIYKLENMVGTGSSRQLWDVTVAPIGQMAKNELPEVANAVRLENDNADEQFSYGDKTFYDTKPVFADPSLFSVFDIKLKAGAAKENPFPDLHTVVISESTARKFFGNENPLGKTILANEADPYKVTGVYEDLPHNSSLQFDMVFPFERLSGLLYKNNDNGRNLANDFSRFTFDTYLLLQAGVNTQQLAEKLRTIHLRNKPDDTDLNYLLQPLTAMHLYHSDGSDAGIGTVRMFTIIALLILVIACINYVNLSTARSLLRAKEVSMRKIAGAARSQLFLQFTVETVLLFLLASTMAIGLMKLLMPLYNSVSGKSLQLALTGYNIWLVPGAVCLGTFILSAIYPALLLSSFEPLKALKGKIASRISETGFRKTLVVTQFVFSVVLITGTIIIGKQLHYIRTKNLGYDKSHVLSLYMRNLGDHYDAVKADLLKQPGIQQITRSNFQVIQTGSQTGNNDWDGKVPNSTLMIYPMSIDHDFIPFFDMELAAGKNFTGSKADSSHFILNETAIRETGIKDPVGKRFRIWENEGTIIGVVKDFHFASMKQKIGPAVFFYNPYNTNRMFIKTTGKDIAATLQAVEREWKQYNADYPFSYAFLDESYDKLYRGEERTGTLFNVFAAIAVIISCLGLLGLATYTAQVKTREIGVRKVLGATVTSIIQLLVRDFIKLVLIAIVIAIPITWYSMNQWLQDFVYRIDIGWSVFAIGGILAVGIALLTVSFQAARAAMANPVKSLRTE